MFGVSLRAQMGSKIPSEPLNVQLADTDTRGEVSVSWTENYAGSYPILDNTIEWYQSGTRIGGVSGVQTNPYVVPAATDGLTEGNVYTFRVTARNLSGSSAQSADSIEWHVATVTSVLSNGVFTAPSTKSYTFHVVGGGGGGATDGGTSPGYGGGGSSGYYTEHLESMVSGAEMQCSIGAGGIGSSNGSATTINLVGGPILQTVNGGLRGLTTNGRDGGSGSGNGGYGDPVKAGGYGGRGGTNGQATGGKVTGVGQLGLAYGTTTGINLKIPSGGSGSYFIGPVPYDGIYTVGAGQSGGQDQSATGRGCGSGGTSWSRPARNGGDGMVVVFG